MPGLSADTGVRFHIPVWEVILVEDNIALIRNELLAGTASVVDCNKRLIAICRLAQREKFRNLDGETLKRATFTACLQVARNQGGNSSLTEGGCFNCMSGRGS